MSGGQSNGRTVSEETKEILRKKGKEQWLRKTDEERKSIIKNNLLCGGVIGHPVSAETREKLRKANLGKKQSRETIEKRKETFCLLKENGYIQTNAGHKKKVLCVENNTVYPSVKECSMALGIDPSGISSVLRGRQKTSHNLHFEYFEGVETNRDECSGVGRG